MRNTDERNEIAHLVVMAQAGDVEAYQRLASRFQAMAYKYACAVLGDVHLAEDVVQDAFLEAFQRLPALHHPIAFARWLKQIVFKHCDRQSRGKRLRAIDCGDTTPTPLDWEPSVLLEKRELAMHVQLAIQSLPEHQREATSLFFLKGCSQRDVAAFLGVPISTVKKRLQLARQAIKEKVLAFSKGTRAQPLDDAFAAHVVAGLLSSPSLLEIDGHPIKRIWREVQAALPDFAVIRGDEVMEARSADSVGRGWSCPAIPVDSGSFLRTHALGDIRMLVSVQSLPVRILTAGRAFRPCFEGTKHRRAFHHIEAVCIEPVVGIRGMQSTVNRLLVTVLGKAQIRWQEVASELYHPAFSIAVENAHGSHQIGSAGRLKDDVLWHAGIDATTNAGFVFGLGAERLAMLRFGMNDIRELWESNYLPVVDNFVAMDQLTAEFSAPDRVMTKVSGVIPGAGRVTPGQTSLTPDGFFTVRGQTISGNRIEGGWVGFEEIKLNIELNRETGVGVVNNRTRLQVEWPERGLAGTFSGVFSGELRDGGVRGTSVFRGSGGFEGMVAIVYARSTDLSEPFQYDACVLEPSHR